MPTEIPRSCLLVYLKRARELSVGIPFNWALAASSGILLEASRVTLVWRIQFGWRTSYLVDVMVLVFLRGGMFSLWVRTSKRWTARVLFWRGNDLVTKSYDITKGADNFWRGQFRAVCSPLPRYTESTLLIPYHARHIESLFSFYLPSRL